MTANDAQEQLEFIKKVMEETRRDITGDGVDFLRWGILSTIGVFLTYFYVLFRWPDFHIWIIWVVLIGLGWIFSIRSYLKTRKARATSYTGRLVGRIYGGYGVASTILGFLGPMFGAYSPNYIVAVISAILGAAYYGTSLIFGSRWMAIFAVGWWCCSIIMFAFPVIHTLLLFGVMMICFQVIPAYTIYRVNRKAVKS
ncbi:MAG: hypothetical protein ABSB78_02955 [Bacteroidota bacterium]